MVFKLFSNVYIGKNYEINNVNTLSANRIKSIISITDTPNTINNIIYVSFHKTKSDASFYEALHICLHYIQNTIYRNENILICCDDGCTETSAVILNYMISYLNMSYNNAMNFVINHFDIDINNNKYCEKLRYKFTKESILVKKIE